MSISRAFLIGVFGFLAGLAPAWPQTGSGAIRGLVTDPAGASIPGAVVTAKNGHGTTRSTSADVRGEYLLTNLPAGVYTVGASAKGFTAAERTDIAVAGATPTLDFPLSLASANQSLTVSDSSQSAQVQVDPSANADALVMRGSDLDALSDDPDDLAADLAALAGPGAGPNGGQIYIDGFTGGRLPAKSAIREVRINQNPFSAQYDRIGMGRVEVFTKPGSDAFQGNIQTHEGSDIFNARNPFTPVKPTWQRLGLEGELSGPIGKKTSFFADFEVRKMDREHFCQRPDSRQQAADGPGRTGGSYAAPRQRGKPQTRSPAVHQPDVDVALHVCGHENRQPGRQRLLSSEPDLQLPGGRRHRAVRRNRYLWGAYGE
jgi:hypothetical protein